MRTSCMLTIPFDVFKMNEPVEAYCLDCKQYHLTYGEVGGTSDFPVAQCPECEANWEEFLAKYGTPINK